MSSSKLDLRIIARFQGKSGRAKTVLSEGEVSIDTSNEEKQFVAGQVWPGDEGALRKSSKAMCPVMNTLIDKKTARSKQMVREFQGKKYFLCCQTCVTLFDKNPSAYTGQKGT